MNYAKNDRAHTHAALLAAAIMVLLAAQTQAQTPPAQSERYPNELPALRLYAAARWNKLTPLVSTAADVRRVMGEPSRVYDVTRLGGIYPGDAKAEQPVFIYEDADYTTHIYFGRYCLYTAELKGKASDRLCQIVIAPKRNIPVEAGAFTSAFRREAKRLPGESWDEYADEDGLVYIVKNGVRGLHLNRIMYGARKAELSDRATSTVSERSGVSNVTTSKRESPSRAATAGTCKSSSVVNR